MNRPLPAALALVLAAAAAFSLTTAPATAGGASNSGGAPLELALIADTPYGDVQRTQFPALVQDINDDPQVRWVLHAGDIKSGGATCDDARFADLAALYGTFADPSC